MAKAVFTHKAGSVYDDLPEERYHFPRAYLRQIEATVGDLIVYYEPGRTGLGERERTGRRAYVATARVQRLVRDPRQADHFYALIEPGSYVVFDRPVPFREGRHFYERQLRREDGATSKGAFGRAVRPLSEQEYEDILCAGFAQELALAGLIPDLPGEGATERFLAEEAATFERPVVERLLSRPVRDAAFARAVQAAYEQTCAVTGLRIINGGGHAEVQAAHIRPVADQGPDSVRNGLALSGTVHWMFDRGLISIAPDFSLLVTSRGLPDEVLRLFAPDRRLHLPSSPLLRPAPSFLEYHRTVVFKG
jgi:putative restriction endonuclease